jgi:hypothetical protein
MREAQALAHQPDPSLSSGRNHPNNRNAERYVRQRGLPRLNSDHYERQHNRREMDRTISSVCSSQL